MRILVTGGRDLDDYLLVARGISVALEDARRENPELNTVVVVHGDHSGADKLASEFVNKTHDLLKGWGVNIIEEPHHAKWSQHGKSAGPIRNREMVNLGADVCLAFPTPGSKGTWDCVIKARRAGIPVVIYKESGADKAIKQGTD